MPMTSGALLPPPETTQGQQPQPSPSPGTGGTALTGQQEIVVLALTPQQVELVRFTQLDGGTVDEDMSGVIAGLRQGKHYYDQEAPNGSWTFTGTKGLEVTHRFDNAEVEFTWLYAYPETLNELEIEMWRRPVTLDPGESVSMHQELEVQPL